MLEQKYWAFCPDGYQQSLFCERYRVWRGKLDVVMCQDHPAGEKLFVGHARQTVGVIDRATGEPREAQVNGAPNAQPCHAEGTFLRIA